MARRFERSKIYFREGTVSTPGSTDVKILEYLPEAVLDGEELDQLVIAPGWGTGSQVLRRTAQAFAQHGYHTTTFDHHRHQQADHTPEAYKARTLTRVIEASGDTDRPVAVVGHSEGGISTALALQEVAMANSETHQRIERVSLVASAGLTGPTKFHDLFTRGAMEMFTAFPGGFRERFRAMEAGIIMAQYAIKNINLNLAEAREISGIDIVPILESQLVDHKKAIGIVACTRDRLFPYKLMEHHSNRQLQQYEPLFDFTTNRSNHTGFIANSSLIDQVDEQLLRLERGRQQAYSEKDRVTRA